MHSTQDPCSPRTIITIRDLCNNGSLDAAFKMVCTLENRGFPISRDIIYCLLQGCKKRRHLGYVRKVRTLMLKHGFHTISSLGDHIIRLFAACGSLEEAYEAFSSIVKPSVFTWNSLISAHLKLGEGHVALKLYERIREEGINPDRVTFISVCNACGSIGSIVNGMTAHHQAIQNSFESDTVLGNAIIDMYAKCGCFDEAWKLFESTVKADIITWTVIISGYSSHGHGDHALKLFTRMHEKGIIPNKAILLCALRACSYVGSIYPGYLIHEEILEYGLELDAIIMSSVIDMYAKSGSLSEAQKVFSDLRSNDVVSWGALIDGYAQNGQGHAALKSYINMLHGDVTSPNEVVFLGVLKACGNIGAIMYGMLTHVQILERDLESNVSIGSALVDMYTKCKCLGEAYHVFIRLRDRNIVSWGAMIAGLSQCDQELDAFQLFNEMVAYGMQPNRVIILCILKDCGAIEAHENGMLIHDLVLQMGLGSDLAIGNTLVHMYAKCGNLKGAQKVFDDVLNPDVVSFGALISGYSHQGHGVLALDLFRQMQAKGIKPERATFLSLLRACAHMGAGRHGNLIYGQIVENQLDSGLLISNALVDMYAKTGRLYDAYKIYMQMSSQDVVSCGTMIEGFTQQGDNEVAREILKGMSDTGVKPDDAIFSSILTGCSNAGLLEEGHEIFMTMKDTYGIIPTTKHYGSLIDLLARAGKLYWAQDLLQTMPVFPDIITWTCLLDSCKNYRNMELGKHCFSQLLHLAPVDISSHDVMVGLLANSHGWEGIDSAIEHRNYLGAPMNFDLLCFEREEINVH